MKVTRRRFTNEALALAIASVLCIGEAITPRAEAATGSADEKAAIAATADAFVAAFHKADAKAIAAFWTPDGDYIDQTGRVLKGRDAIEKAFSELFAEDKGLKLRIESESLRFPTPDTAVEDGTSSVLAPDGTPPSRARYSNVLVKRDGKWLLASVRDSPYVPPSNAEHLGGLDWAIGEWVDKVEGEEVGHVTFEWTPEKNFIVSTYEVTLKGVLMSRGTQWIGWDPATRKTRSWTFESDGGFGEGSWAQEGGKWVIKTTTILPDGKRLTATNIVTRLGDGEIAWQSKDRTLDGKALPDIKEIKLKRAS